MCDAGESCVPLTHSDKGVPCQLGVERRVQREAAVSSALALRRQFTIHGDVLEHVEVFKYLGRLLAQDDDDAQAV